MTKRKADAPTGDENAHSTPSQQDEADIVAEAGAVPANDGSGDLVVDEAKIKELGAIDAESIRDNRRAEEIISKKRAGKDANFNMDSVLEKYEWVTKYWPANTIDINVKRVSGGPSVTWVIQNRPKTGADLYAAILAQHGRCDSAEYEVRFIDFTTKQKRGTGRIVMPDTRDTPPSLQPAQGQQIPYGQPPPSQAPQAPTTDPVAMMGRMFEIFQQMQKPTASVPQPVPAPAPASFPGQSTDPMAMMSQMFGMFQKMQQSVQPTPQSPSPPSTDPMAMMQEMARLFQQVQTPTQPQVAPAVMPPPPPPGSDPGAMMEWMQRAFHLFQKTSQPLPAVVVQPAAPPPVDPMAMMGKMFEMFQQMQRSMQPPVPREPPYRDPSGQFSGGPGPGQGPYRGPRPYYQGPPGQQGGYPPQYPPQQPPPRPKTAAEEFRDAIGVVDMAVSIADRFRPPAPAAEPDRDDDDSPVKVVDVGGWPVIINRDDGSSRKWESVVANVPNMLKWLAEQREAIQKAAAEREARQQPKPRQQQPLPPGYVEVTPGYRPPPGYVAVPVEMDQGLPPPPDDLPPPITQEERPRPQRTWGAPTMPGPGDGG
jgi:hypothetical protein